MNTDLVRTKDLVYNKNFPTVILVEDVKLLDGFRVHLTFNDGVERDVDLEPVIWGPVFEQIRNDSAYFRQVFVDPMSKTLTWPNGVDLDPDSLYYGDQEAPWWTEYKKQQKKKSARARKPATRKRKTPVTSQRVTKTKTRSKPATKPRSRKTVPAKEK